MEGMSLFEIIAGSCSILAVVVGLIKYLRKGLKSYNDRKRRVEEEFQNEMQMLKSSGNNVSARTDLGFLVLMELGSMRNVIDRNHHFSTSAYVLGAFLLTLGLYSEAIDKIVILLICAAAILFGLVCHLNGWRMENFVINYEVKVKEIWKTPVEKRSS
jgi:hypothetical protein